MIVFVILKCLLASDFLLCLLITSVSSVFKLLLLVSLFGDLLSLCSFVISYEVLDKNSVLYTGFPYLHFPTYCKPLHTSSTSLLSF